MREILVDEKSDAKVTGFDRIESANTEKWRWALGGVQTIRFPIDETPATFFYKIHFPLENSRFGITVDGVEIQSIQIDAPRIVYGSIELAPLRKSGEICLVFSITKWKTGKEPGNGDSRPLAYVVERGFVRERKWHLNFPRRKPSFLPFLLRKRKPLAIVYGIDEGYLIPAAVSIRSVLERSDPRRKKRNLYALQRCGARTAKRRRRSLA